MKTLVKDIPATTDEILRLEQELKELQSLHRYAWNAYGSELCSGEMVAKENAIIHRLKELYSSIGREYLTPIESLRRKTEKAKALLKQERTESKNGNNS